MEILDFIVLEYWILIITYTSLIFSTTNEIRIMIEFHFVAPDFRSSQQNSGSIHQF